MAGWFSLEAVYAKKGDAFILHYGSARNRKWILIDGGHNGVYEAFLRPRLDELRRRQSSSTLTDDGKLPIEMVMISHADSDHIKGVLDLFAEERAAIHGGAPSPVEVDQIWFNGFNDLIASQAESVTNATVLAEIAQSLESPSGGPNLPLGLRDDRNSQAVISSTRQGRQLQEDAVALDIPINEAFDNELVMRGDQNDPIQRFSPGLKFTLLGPSKLRIEKFRKKWRQDLKEILKDEENLANAQAFNDGSAFNLASIMVLAERGGKTMLLTGDGRGDHLIEGLRDAELLVNGKIHVDLFKIPHHGSDNNVTEGTFAQITAMHYVISGNGEHGNPEPAMLDMLADGRKMTRNDDFTLHLTIPERAFEAITIEQANRSTKRRKQREALQGVHDWLTNKKPNNMTVVYRDRDAFSISVDLGTKKVPQ